MFTDFWVRTGTRKNRAPREQKRLRRARRLVLEPLEERYLLAGPPPIPPLLLPAVTIGLTAEQVKHADAVINWNATMLRAIWTDAGLQSLVHQLRSGSRRSG